MTVLIQLTVEEAEPSFYHTAIKVVQNAYHNNPSFCSTLLLPSLLPPPDHMSGLDSDDLLRVLKERKIDFYCSEVTQSLLSNDPEFSHLIPYLVIGRSLGATE